MRSLAGLLLSGLFVACTSSDFNNAPLPSSVSFQTNPPAAVQTFVPSSTPMPTETKITTSIAAPTATTTATAPTSTPPPTPTPTTVTTTSPTPAAQTISPKPRSTVTATPVTRKRQVIFVGGICSTNSKDDFIELESWLTENMGPFNPAYYNYELGGRSGETYDRSTTLKSIDGRGGSSENLRNFIMRYISTDEIYVISFSLGGVIALNALVEYPELQRYVRGILTVDSPIRGEGKVRLDLGSVFTCAREYQPPVPSPGNPPATMLPVFEDLYMKDSRVIQVITGTDYSATGVRVVNLANSNDLVISPNGGPAGTMGTAPKAMYFLHSFGINLDKEIPARYFELARTILEQHALPLKIKTLEKLGINSSLDRDALSYVKDALRCTFVGDNCAYGR